MENIKITLEDLRKAIGWVEKESNALHVEIYIYDRKLYMSCTDRMDRIVKIELFSTEGHMMPKITKTEVLR